MKVRGKEFIFKNKGSGKDIKVFPMFHPNFLINNPSEKKKLGLIYQNTQNF